MALIELDIPSPRALRGGWALMAAAFAARGWTGDTFATEREWFWHDGAGNWAAIRYLAPSRAILFGHDHEYSDTYFREAATYFEMEETDLLKDAPAWWGTDLSLPRFAEWIGFIYGWDGAVWRRVEYRPLAGSDDPPDDGFQSVRLLDACSVSCVAFVSEFLTGDEGNLPNPTSVQALVDADAQFTSPDFEAVMPGHDTDAAIAAARAFLKAPV